MKAKALKFLFLVIAISIINGLLSAFFLQALEFVSITRENNLWLIFFLPLAGFLSGWMYWKYGQNAENGTALLIEKFAFPEKKIDWLIAPLILFGTLITHMFGGSAGREGTAIQMGGSVAVSVSKSGLNPIKNSPIWVVIGFSSGFAGVFGTPFAAAIFAIEILKAKNWQPYYLLIGVLSAFVGSATCHLTGTKHTIYPIIANPQLSYLQLLLFLVATICFGLTAILFLNLVSKIKKISKNLLPYWPIRAFMGGLLLMIIFVSTNTFRYTGLGIPVILEAFEAIVPFYDFLAKLGFTAVTVGTGFKGGEVTPLFFMGATLGNTLSNVLSLPLGFLVSVGFVSVFAGASKTPFASMVMAVELFGIDAWPYFLVGCFFANWLSEKIIKTTNKS